MSYLYSFILQTVIFLILRIKIVKKRIDKIKTSISCFHIKLEVWIRVTPAKSEAAFIIITLLNHFYPHSQISDAFLKAFSSGLFFEVSFACKRLILLNSITDFAEDY